MSKKKVAVLVGSLRKESFNRKIANEFLKMAPESLEMEIVEIGHLPLYNQDYDENSPKEYVEFREKIKSMDAFLFVSPEHNRSISAALKNAIDIASRPWGENLWAGKPGGVATTSISSIGAFGANHSIRQSMVFLDVYMMQQPEAYIGNAYDLFDENNNLRSEDTKAFLQDFINAYENWVNRF